MPAYQLRERHIGSVAGAKEVTGADGDGPAEEVPGKGVGRDQGESSALRANPHPCSAFRNRRDRAHAISELGMRRERDGLLSRSDRRKENMAPGSELICGVSGRHPDAGVDDQGCHFGSSRFLSAARCSRAVGPGGAFFIASWAASIHESGQAVGVEPTSSCSVWPSQRR